MTDLKLPSWAGWALGLGIGLFLVLVLLSVRRNHGSGDPCLQRPIPCGWLSLPFCPAS